VTDPRDDELDLDLQFEDAPPAAPAPAAPEAAPTSTSSADPAPAPSAPDVAHGASVVTAPAPSAVQDAGLEGQWVWQFAAAPPPAPFSSVFFAGRAFPELYRFFAAGVLVALGTLLPWGASAAWLRDIGAEVAATDAGPAAGCTSPVGALCLALALWLIWASCYGIASGRQKILPVFLMLLPTYVTWSRTLDAWGRMPAEWSVQLRGVEVFEGAGPGVMLALAGCTLVTLQLVVSVGRLFRKAPKAGVEKARVRTPRDVKAAKAEAGGAVSTMDAAAGARAKVKADGDKGGRRGKQR